MRRMVLLFAVFLSSVSTLEAQSLSDHPRVREVVGLIEVWLDAQRAYQRIPGISAALVHDQEVIWAGATGYADPDTGTPAKAHANA